MAHWLFQGNPKYLKLPFVSTATLRTHFVSIPKRVSEALKLRAFKHLGINERFQVSIPKRVSEALKPFPIIKPFVVCVFQSLKGFQRL